MRTIPLAALSGFFLIGSALAEDLRVQFRANPNAPWHLYATIVDPQRAQTIVEQLRRAGYQARIANGVGPGPAYAGYTAPSWWSGYNVWNGGYHWWNDDHHSYHRDYYHHDDQHRDDQHHDQHHQDQHHDEHHDQHHDDHHSDHHGSHPHPTPHPHPHPHSGGHHGGGHHGGGHHR